MKYHVDDVTIECVRGDITAQEDVDAIVNAANAELRPGGGVAGAIHRAAGPGLEEEARRHAPIEPGDAVITKGHDLAAPWVIHCLGPVYGQDEPAPQLLGKCYENALRVAESKALGSVAFPAISTGAFGFPLREAAGVAAAAVAQAAPRLRSVRHVRFTLFDDEALSAHDEAFRAELDKRGPGERAFGKEREEQA